MVERRESDVAKTEPLREKRTRDAVEPGVPGKPRREQFVARRSEDDRQWFGAGGNHAAHWNATSFSEIGLYFSTELSVMHSTPVSIASIAKSLSIRKMRELTPPLSWRTRRRPFTVNTLGSRNGRLRTMARTSCSNSLPAVHRGNVTASKRRAN